MNHLRDCPFCGSKETHGRMILVGDDQHYTIICDDCRAFVIFDNDNDQSIADVINRYNRRATQ